MFRGPDHMASRVVIEHRIIDVTHSGYCSNHHESSNAKTFLENQESGGVAEWEPVA
jgi:hypothetical protein